jgi:hypothetical protein
MLTGFNTNFRYRGVLFHVQTEDSGVENPRVMSHLFKGGDILASLKGDYSDKLDIADLEGEVRALMEGQHKAMLRSLIRGEQDAVIMERMGPEVFANEHGGDTDVTLPPAEVTLPDGDEMLLDPGDVLEEAGSAGEVTEGTIVSEPAENPAESENPKEQLARTFGDGVESQKPLDEVVLDYLVDAARHRKRRSK